MLLQPLFPSGMRWVGVWNAFPPSGTSYFWRSRVTWQTRCIVLLLSAHLGMVWCYQPLAALTGPLYAGAPAIGAIIATGVRIGGTTELSGRCPLWGFAHTGAGQWVLAGCALSCGDTLAKMQSFYC
ncbi:hypothetical protein [Paenibacillus bouchesdurhonensis]|uniref:hypothetical protein n=1 Tax=Paenibacillus bouchesdurhonensis TaxID=1870990 RepID=UPI000DA5F4AF|nr:hypothetical protein [Paenibacillus bouchesdurhonensis]